MILQAIALLVLAALAAAPVRAVDLNGIVLGSQATPEALKAQLGVDVPPSAQGAHIASGTYRGLGALAGAGVYASVHIDEAGAVDEIRATFSPDALGWGRIAPAAVAKWGKPAISTTVDVSNAFGLKLQDDYWVWDFPDHSRAVLIHYIDVDNGEISITTEARTPKPAKGGTL